jgi:uncharacterized membrane protein
MKSIEGWYETPAHDTNPGFRAPHETPEEIVRRRYAAGEIDRDEYLRRQRDLAEH